MAVAVATNQRISAPVPVRMRFNGDPPRSGGTLAFTYSSETMRSTPHGRVFFFDVERRGKPGDADAGGCRAGRAAGRGRVAADRLSRTAPAGGRLSRQQSTWQLASADRAGARSLAAAGRFGRPGLEWPRAFLRSGGTVHAADPDRSRARQSQPQTG